MTLTTLAQRGVESIKGRMINAVAYEGAPFSTAVPRADLFRLQTCVSRLGFHRTL